MANLERALNQAGRRAQEKVACIRHVVASEFENTARQFEAETRHVRDQEVSQAARHASLQSDDVHGRQHDAAKSQLERAIQGASAYNNEFHNSDFAILVLKHQANQQVGRTQAAVGSSQSDKQLH